MTPRPPADGLVRRPPSRCPSCGRNEARRIAAWRLELYATLPADRVCETVRCRRCGSIYTITAGDYVRLASR